MLPKFKTILYATGLGPGDSSIQVIEGYPAQAILDVADNCSADMIIMAAHHRTIVGEVMIGGTTRKVLHNANQQVLIVKIPKGIIKSSSNLRHNAHHALSV